ncbi:MAG TPA: hypothetical protein VEC35_15210 [Noviherbaspirillum sp.]|nr:hypothetical protein [Noviherbaspirillum sp.]
MSIAASASASVVWLTAITLLSDFGSAFGATLAALLAVFDSDFLFVTGAFSFSGAGFAAARDEGFDFDGVALVAVLGVVLATVFVAALIGVFALLAGAAAVVFFTAGFAIDLPEAGLVAADFAFFAVTVVFAGFFIAFAMESIPTGLLSSAE